MPERDPLPFRRHRQRDVRLPWDVDWTSDGKKQHYTNRVDPLAQEHDAAQSGRKSGWDKGREADGKGREADGKGREERARGGRRGGDCRREELLLWLFNLVCKY